MGRLHGFPTCLVLLQATAQRVAMLNHQVCNTPNLPSKPMLAMAARTNVQAEHTKSGGRKEEAETASFKRRPSSRLDRHQHQHTACGCLFPWLVHSYPKPTRFLILRAPLHHTGVCRRPPGHEQPTQEEDGGAVAGGEEAARRGLHRGLSPDPGGCGILILLGQAGRRTRATRGTRLPTTKISGSWPKPTVPTCCSSTLLTFLIFLVSMVLVRMAP